MRTFSKLPVSLAALLAAALLPGVANAQTAVTDPVGFVSLPLPANSDTFISIPFTRAAEFTGSVNSVSGGTITLTGTPGFAANRFAPLVTADPATGGHNTYYAIIGPKNAALSPTLSVTNGSTAATASGALPGDLFKGDTVTVGGHTFTVAAVSGTSLTLDRAFPDATANGLAGTYNHSPSEGRFYTVSANDAGSLTVNLNGDSLAPNVTAGTQVSVIPYWTLGTVFPAGDAGKSFTISSSPKIRGTQILILDLAFSGINPSAKSINYFLNGSWQQAGNTDSAKVINDELIVPDAYFIVRNSNTSTTFTPTGSVAVSRLSVPLTTNQNSQQDNAVALARPTDVTLDQLGLVTSGAFTPSQSTKQRGDLLLLFDNNLQGFNKSADGIYFYLNGSWRKAGDPDPNATYNLLTIPAGTGFIVRKNQSANPTTFWQNSRNFLN